MSKEFFRYQHIEEMPGVVISEAIMSRFRFHPHFHLDYHVGLLIKGTQHQKIQGKKLDLEPGKICLMPPGEVHDGASNGDTLRHLKTFRIPSEIMQDALFDIQHKETPLHLAPSIIQETSLNQAFLQLSQAHHSPHSASQLHKDTLWTTALSSLLLSVKKQPQDQLEIALTPQQMQTVRDYCEAYLSHKIPLNDLARLCGLTRFQFIRRFQKQTGLAPHAWLMRLRLERACIQLSQANVMIADVAAHVGFYDQSHFNRTFKQAYGVAPSAYRLSC